MQKKAKTFTLIWNARDKVNWLGPQQDPLVLDAFRVVKLEHKYTRKSKR
jgi:hypothetical protein